MTQRIAAPGSRPRQHARLEMARAATSPGARPWEWAVWVVVAAATAVALMLSGCAPAARSTTPATSTRQPRLYAMTRSQPSPTSSAAPTVHVAALAPDDGSTQWGVTPDTAYPFHQVVATALGDTLYVTSDHLPTNPNDTSTPTGALSAMRSSDGHALWKAQLGVFISAPVVSNGILYSTAIQSSGQGSSATRSKWVYALHTSDGSRVWKMQLPGDFGLTDDVVLVDGVLYIASNQFCFDSCSAAYLFAVRASDGKLLWKQTISGNLNVSAPTVDHGVVFLSVPTVDTLYGGLRKIMAYDAATGASLWSRVTYLEDSYLGSRQFVAANGLVYTGLAKPVASDPYRPDHWTYALAALDGRTGAARWQVSTNLYPYIYAHDDQALYVQTQTATAMGSVKTQSLAAYALSDGTRHWQTPTDPQAQVAGLVDGVLYENIDSITAGVPARMDALDTGAGVRRWQIQLAAAPGTNAGGSRMGPFTLTNDALYVVINGETLYALAPSDGHVRWRQTFDSAVIDLQYAS
ncbi:MAG TPA: PQQ-binding-like beta-propeller repeat protein [Ktedonobacterales bacterium]|nr:PQQ-binding-like beta-propeller repeat protein [Ktedonobacterales bacterium]